MPRSVRYSESQRAPCRRRTDIADDSAAGLRLEMSLQVGLPAAKNRRGSEPRRGDLVADILDGAAEQAQASARRPASERVDLSGDLTFCLDVDRSAFAMVGEIHKDHVVLASVPC